MPGFLLRDGDVELREVGEQTLSHIPHSSESARCFSGCVSLRVSLFLFFWFCILRAKSDLLLALGTLRFRIKERRSQRNRWFRCSSQVVLGMGVGAEKQKQNPNVLALLDSLLPPFLESFSNCSRILSIRNKLTTQKQ